MESTLEFISRIGQELLEIHLHKTRSPHRDYNCTNLAKEVARKLISENRTPKIKRVGRMDDDHNFLDTMYPQRYPGHKGFKYHDFCECDGDAWDPMLGKPVPLGDYCMESFGKIYEISDHGNLNKRIEHWIAESQD